MAKLDTSQRLELEYETIRADNNFKTFDHGKNLFFKWRKGNLSTSELAKKFGCTRSALYNLSRRLDERVFSKDQTKEIQKKHAKQVAKTKEKIDKANSLLKQTGNKPAGRVEGTTFDDMVQYLKDQLKMADRDEADWQDILLRMHQILIMKEWDVYEKTRTAGLRSPDVKDKKDLLDISDKKVKQLLTMIQQNISEYGTLLSSAAADVMTDQEQQLDKLASFVLENNLDRLDEVVELVDRSG